MKKLYKTPLWLKLIIACTTWSILFALIISLVSNQTAKLVIATVGIVILLYNIIILCLIHWNINPNEPDDNDLGPWAI